MKDNRKHIRHRVFIEPFYCSRCDSENDSIEITDISCYGIGVSTPEKLEKGESIDLEIVIPDDDIPLFVRGKVVWVSKIPNANNNYNAGIRLTKIDKCDKKRLVEYFQSTFNM